MLLPYERLVLHLKQPDLGHNTSRSTWVLMREEMLGHVDVAGIRDDKFGISFVQHTFTHDGSKLADSKHQRIPSALVRKGIFIIIYLYVSLVRIHHFVPYGICHDLSLHVTRWELRFRDTLWGTELWLVRALSLTSPFAFLLGGTWWNAFAHVFFY